MEIEIVERPKKVIVNKDICVRALREHWDEKEVHLTCRCTSEPKPSRWVRIICFGIQSVEAMALTDCVAPP